MRFLKRYLQYSMKYLQNMAMRLPLVEKFIWYAWIARNKSRFCGESKPDSLRVLYVDTISTPHAQTNVNGIMKAYHKISTLEPFDYRKLANLYRPKLMNKMLVQTAYWFKPDLVHLGKSETVSGNAIKEIKERTAACVIHFYGDFNIEPQPWVVDIGQWADYTLLYHKDTALIEWHRSLGVSPIGFWWVGTDPEVFYPRPMPKIYDVVFMANNTGDFQERTGQGYAGRLDLINAIVAQGINLHLFGKGWDDLSNKPGVYLHPFVNDVEFSKACAAAKITLGYNTNQAYMYTSWRRPLNSMASGAFHLTRYFPGLETVFENGKHLVWFNSIPKAVELIEYYLVHDEEREKIAEAGRLEVLAHHTWDKRIEEMLQYMEQVRKTPISKYKE